MNLAWNKSETTLCFWLSAWRRAFYQIIYITWGIKYNGFVIYAPKLTLGASNVRNYQTEVVAFYLIVRVVFTYVRNLQALKGNVLPGMLRWCRYMTALPSKFCSEWQERLVKSKTRAVLWPCKIRQCIPLFLPRRLLICVSGLNVPCVRNWHGRTHFYDFTIRNA